MVCPTKIWIVKHRSRQKSYLENSLAVQWLGLTAFTAMAQVQALVGELKILQAVKRCGWKKKKKEKSYLVARSVTG